MNYYGDAGTAASLEFDAQKCINLSIIRVTKQRQRVIVLGEWNELTDSNCVGIEQWSSV